MIRTFSTEDMDIVIATWLEASIKAHHFIAREFWESQATPMREMYIPASETWVYESEGEVKGFASYHEGVLAAIFVKPECQSEGVGSALIEHLMEKYASLSLAVYEENEKTVSFYKKKGFELVKQQKCEHTGHSELLMSWTK